MTNVVLDSGAVTALAISPPRRRALHYRGDVRMVVPASVLVECLTGDHRRDHQTNRLLQDCRVVVIDETIARRASLLRTVAGRPTASATDATVVAVAHAVGADVVLTGDAADLGALAAASPLPLRIAEA